MKLMLALENMQLVLKSWASLDADKLIHLDVVNATHHLIMVFATSIYFGAPLDIDMMKDCYPIPSLLPLYPAIPKLLFPLYYRYSAAVSALKEQVDVCPFSSAIKEAASQCGFQESSNYPQHLLTAAGVNAMGLSNPIINLFLLLPLFPKGGQELLQNERLLDSFVYRHNGAVLSNLTKSDTEISDSSGEKYSVKADTILLTDLSMVNRDHTYWYRDK